MLSQYKPKFTYVDQIGNTKIKRTELYNIHYSAMDQYCKEYKRCDYLDIGTNYGHSAFQAWTTFEPKSMVLCDLFNDKRMIPFVERTLVVIGCTSHVTFVSGDTEFSLEKYKDKKFDVILVDGDHTIRGAMRDLRNAWEMLANGGILIFDDLDILRLEIVFDTFIAGIDGVEWVKKHKEWKHGCGVIKKEDK